MNSGPTTVESAPIASRRALRIRDRCRSAHSAEPVREDHRIQDAIDTVGIVGPIDSIARISASDLVDDVQRLIWCGHRRSCRTESPSPKSLSDESVRSRPPRYRHRSTLFLAALRDPQAFRTPQPADRLVVDLPAADGPSWPARRYPHRGGSVEKRRSQAPSSTILSSDRGSRQDASWNGADSRPCGRGRSDTPNRSRSIATALRLRFGSEKLSAQISVSMSMPRAELAANFSTLAFSALSSLSHLALSVFAAILGKPRCRVDSVISRCWHSSASSWPAPSSLCPQ
ncbi:hypothetical protein MULP_00996 [Mycobacterium liflandii 128FXT]|uniref:Uncharacterized protein n=1 Tax=Mycobacterium liflandii (strain 128FXT) TaxID=459424 RepID=L7V3B7_MYCL1|nr:hypothetical protein MULP_00996 [Mycobacterium liflandii 128FXT]RFZ55747.1 hypothetical protein BB170200_03768 [Mycobacterium marinum]